MPFADLRSFVDRLEAEGELRRVAVEVDLAYELGAICRRAADLDGPALLFEHPRGHSMPVLANLLATRRRVALALDATPETLVDVWRSRTREPIPPVTVGAGPCQDNVVEGDDVDLARLLAIPVFNELDAGPYITAGCHISLDPRTGERNVGVYRNQVHGPRTLGISAPPFRHLAQHHVEAERAGEPLPFAIAIGVEPGVFLGAVAPVPAGVDELAIAGALRGSPVELVACRTIPVDVPATAEIVLECELLPGELLEEGPFGEFTGYYATAKPRQVIKVRAVTYRDGAMHQGVYIGRPPNESIQVSLAMNEATIMDQVSLPGLRAVHMTEGGSGYFQAIASIDKPFEGYGKMMGLAILGAWAGRGIKTLIVVDADVDPFDPVEVDWALASRVQPHRDVEILKGMVGPGLDPSISEHEKVSGSSRTSKMIIDATRYDAATYPRTVAPEPDVYERVLAEWQKYGI
jgi:UbiD family decarboxylase